MCMSTLALGPEINIFYYFANNLVIRHAIVSKKGKAHQGNNRPNHVDSHSGEERMETIV